MAFSQPSFLVFVGGSLDKPPEGSQKPHLVFLCFPLPPPSFSSYFLPTEVKVLLLGKYKF
ncbi:hypothetical protein SLEP1_g33374 [Rubroshorea leprosula]|uniref:Uncharacterized protein n=1 Tax=Rubroshorea leprosula TaxID=152421 RepID=A0AAV5KGE6_9ROSI|nr:hypothetical protein SLEP1_g33374 [Rubroshorea leprosula]